MAVKIVKCNFWENSLSKKGNNVATPVTKEVEYGIQTGNAEGGSEGGVNFIDVGNKQVTFHASKILEYLISKGVDVDAEIDGWWYAGIVVGIISYTRGSYLGDSTHDIQYTIMDGALFGISYSNDYWRQASSDMSYNDGEAYTINDVLSNIGDVTIGNDGQLSEGSILIPIIKILPSSQGVATIITPTQEEFLTLITIEDYE